MSSKTHPHICEQCGISFLGKKDQRFCSHAHFRVWSKGRLNVGLIRSPETRKKIGDGSRGHVDSDETRQKKSVSHSGPLHYRWEEDRVALKERLKWGNALRKMLTRAIKKSNLPKTAKAFVMLGYTPEEFRNHIQGLFEPWMNWSNHGNGPGTWQIDHIKTVASFPIGTSPSVINALSNIRPLSTEENLKRPKDKRSLCVA